MSAAPATTRIRRRPARAACGLALLGAWLGGVGAAPAEEPAAGAGAPLERAVKAAYLYNFTRFVTWPGASDPAQRPGLTIGVLADAAFARAVSEAVSGRSVAGRPLAVRHFRSAEQVQPCDVLFVDRARASGFAYLQGRLAGRPVLTVSDAPGFVADGGVIGLFLEDGRVRFEVSDAAARQAGLAVSSKLLRLSRPAGGRACSACGTAGER